MWPHNYSSHNALYIINLTQYTAKTEGLKQPRSQILLSSVSLSAMILVCVDSQCSLILYSLARLYTGRFGPPRRIIQPIYHGRADEKGTTIDRGIRSMWRTIRKVKLRTGQDGEIILILSWEKSFSFLSWEHVP